jgi:hypothetical protein
MILRQHLLALAANAIIVVLISWLIVDGLRALGTDDVQRRADRATEAASEAWRAERASITEKDKS